MERTGSSRNLSRHGSRAGSRAASRVASARNLSRISSRSDLATASEEHRFQKSTSTRDLVVTLVEEDGARQVFAASPSRLAVNLNSAIETDSDAVAASPFPPKPPVIVQRKNRGQVEADLRRVLVCPKKEGS
ncbi:hypothetical protein FVE85_4542 [Porphyridium purpureum]|uniref:Uncharacterized protein n=1 Tax=Porphyridium purpureum TaxID=35688 RepID=A0A5J4YIZ7_PORPP|nr:hypothetical protein FVE85_4542 [Porphyridium purpureum]|eukprot:POR2898..scf297_16